jgi:hypothetical protein
MTRSPAPRDADVRKALIRLAFKNVVHRNSIPAEFISAEIGRSMNEGEAVMHVRLVARSTEPGLLANLYDIQRAFELEVHGVDPSAEGWLQGVTWRIQCHELDEDTALPPPDFWHQLKSERRLRGMTTGQLKRTREELDSEFSVFGRTSAFHHGGDFQDTEPTRW